MNLATSMSRSISWHSITGMHPNTNTCPYPVVDAATGNTRPCGKPCANPASPRSLPCIDHAIAWGRLRNNLEGAKRRLKKKAELANAGAVGMAK